MRVIFFLGFILYCQMTFAQKFGFTLGLNSSNQKHDLVTFEEGFKSFGNRFGLRLGLDYRHYIGSNLYFLTGINYNQKGSNRNATNELTNNTRENKVRLNYLEIPLSFYFTNNNSFAPIGLMGLYTGYLLDGKYDNADFISVFDLNKRLDIGARLGVGIKYLNYNLILNYEFSLNNINNSPVDITSKNRNWNIALTYWPIFKK